MPIETILIYDSIAFALLCSTIYDSVYTLPIQVGSSNQKLYVQVDSGSSDFVSIASSVQEITDSLRYCSG
jgi:hypothetical protein